MKQTPQRIVFVVWAHYSRRAEELSRHLQADCRFFDHLIQSRGAIWRLFFWVDYLYKAFGTLRFLVRYRPDMVFAQSPPSFCPMVCWLYCAIFSKSLVVDAHNSALEYPWVKIPFFPTVLRRAAMVLVHNTEFEAYVRVRYGEARFFMLPDSIPDLSARREEKRNEKYFLIISSFYSDEPIENVLEAALAVKNIIEPGIGFWVTGDYGRCPAVFERYKDTAGVMFLGFVDEGAYIDLLTNAYGVIALTTRAMVQQCASIEAMGAAVPLIVSDSPTSRRLFFKGAVVTETDRQAIADAIVAFCENRSLLAREIRSVSNFWRDQWQQSFQRLKWLLKIG